MRDINIGPHVCSEIRTATEPKTYVYNYYKGGFVALKEWEDNTFWKIMAILHGMDEILTEPQFTIMLAIGEVDEEIFTYSNVDVDA